MGRPGIPDKVGPWAEVKHSILVDYAQQYAYILAKQSNLKFYYVDAFAGKGLSIIRNTSRVIQGSPLRVLDIDPKFHGYIFIDKSQENINYLSERVGTTKNVEFYCGDANEILVEKILPRMTYESFSRVLLFLDPFGLDVFWPVMKMAGSLGTVDFFLNFMTMDLNRNVLWNKRSLVPAANKENFNRVVGEDKWEQIAYDESINLFAEVEDVKKDTINVLKYYKNRLKNDAGFKFVPDPVPIHNKSGAIIYHLFFGSKNPTANRVAKYILNTYRDWRLDYE
jgi:three-Cys-motif partner protein